VLLGLLLVMATLMSTSPAHADPPGTTVVNGFVGDVASRGPLQGVVVEAYDVDAPDAEAATAVTGEDGAFGMTLPDGTYRFLYSAPAGYTSRWHGPGAGARVAVTGGDPIDLGRVLLGRTDEDSVVTGQVRAPGGSPVDDVVVQALREGEVVATARTYAGPDVDHGYFELHLPAGALRLRFVDPAGTYARMSTGYLDVAPGRTVWTGSWTLRLPRGTLTGLVRTADGTPLANSRVKVYELGGRGFARKIRTVTNAEGRYTVAVPGDRLPGSFTVCSARQYSQRCLGGDRPSRDHAVELAPAERAEAPTIVWDTVGVSGRFVDHDGQAVAMRHVFLVRYVAGEQPGDERILWRDARMFDAADGEFAFEVARPQEEYSVCGRTYGPAGVTACYGNVGDEESARRAVTPPSGHIVLDDIVVDGATIEGDVVDLRGNPVLHDFYVDIYRIADGEAIQAGTDYATGPTYGIGTQRTSNPDARYTVCVWSSVDYGNATWCLSDDGGLVDDPLEALTFPLPDLAVGRMPDLVTDWVCEGCPEPAAEVGAVVRTRAGDPVAGPIVMPYRWDGDRWVAQEEALGGDDGRVVAHVPAGTYTFRYLRAGMQPVFLGGSAEMPSEPSPASSVVVGDDLAPVDLGSITLTRQLTSFGTPVAGEYGVDHDFCLSRFLDRNDDGSTGPVEVPFPLSFFGQSYPELFVNNNGNVTFGERLSTYTPSAFGDGGSYDGPPIIAPFFADVDTRHEDSNVVTYGTNAAGNKLCVNWTDVGYYGSHADKLNSFQLILTKAVSADREAGDFDIQFNYDRVQWETGDASDGENGLGGTSALAGFTAGTPDVPGTVVQLPGSLENGALLDSGQHALVGNSLNAGGRPGRYNFSVLNGSVAQLLGSLTGRVTAENGGAGVAGALVEPCRLVSGQTRCSGSVPTDAEGRFTVVGLVANGTENTADRYTLRVSPPSGSRFFAGVGYGRVVAGETTDLTATPIMLREPRAVPPSATVGTAPGSDTSGFAPYVREDGVLQMYWRTDLAVSVLGCPGFEAPTFSFTVGGTVVDEGSMTESPEGTYSASARAPFPLAGEGSFSTNVPSSCEDGAAPAGFDVYIDPSGTVTDQFGLPLSGVTATLMRSDTAGGPFAAVPDGSAIMSPANRVNPHPLGDDGAFAWFVQSGHYRVDATRPGCTDTSTSEMPVPPERLALLIKMQCTGATVTPGTEPTVNGTVQVGSLLTATPATWPGLIASTRIEWLRGVTVVGTGATYTPTAADAGQALTVRSFGKRPDYRQENREDGDLVSFDETFATVTTAPVAAAPGGGNPTPTPTITNTVKPAITGDAVVGGALAASQGTWSTDGLAFAYQWLRDGTPIAGATAAEYTPGVADMGKPVSVKVTATRPGSTPGTATSDPVTVEKGAAPQNSAKPAITGTPELGETLTGSDGEWDLEDLTFGYQWLRDGEVIEGATEATYVVTAAVQQGLVRPEQLGLELLRIRRDRRRPLLHEVVNELLDGARSLGELDVARALRERGLPAPARQVLRRDGRGRYYLDLYWPQFRLVVEVDGIHHSWAENVVGDALRQNALTMQGDRVLRLPLLGFRLEREAFLDQVEEAMVAAGFRRAA
jgi:very-short-patch-repair endonuclease/5-hydroxyisourate hydrolase-like protein (transthyretin family)